MFPEVDHGWGWEGHRKAMARHIIGKQLTGVKQQ